LGAVALCAALTGCAGWMPPRAVSNDDAAAAREDYQRMLRAQAVTARPDETSAQKLHEGDMLERRGDMQRAMLAYFEAASLAPSEIEPRLRLGVLQIQVNPERAQRSLQALVDERPEVGPAWFGLGLAHVAQGKLDLAQRAVEHAIELGPRNPALYCALGAVEERLGRPENARATFERGLELYPDEPMLLNNLAVSHLVAREPALAEPLLRRASKLEPGDAAIHNNLGLASGLQGYFDEALREFRHAGDEQAALNNLGYVYFLLGRNEQAIETYERALLVGGSHSANVLANLRRAVEASH
jgi:Flp pilus assembly protein TadD